MLLLLYYNPSLTDKEANAVHAQRTDCLNKQSLDLSSCFFPYAEEIFESARTLALCPSSLRAVPMDCEGLRAKRYLDQITLPSSIHPSTNPLSNQSLQGCQTELVHVFMWAIWPPIRGKCARNSIGFQRGRRRGS